MYSTVMQLITTILYELYSTVFCFDPPTQSTILTHEKYKALDHPGEAERWQLIVILYQIIIL